MLDKAKLQSRSIGPILQKSEYLYDISKRTNI